MDKIAIFIDGGYLSRILKEQYGERRIDLGLLGDTISGICGAERLRSYFYHCLPLVRFGSAEDQRRHANMQQYLSHLKSLPRLEVRLGKLQCIGGHYKQKMVDVLLSLDIVDMCFHKHIQQAAIIAGDYDFVPALRKAKASGAVVHLFYHPSSVHNELLDESDERHPLTQELLDSCS